MLRTRGTPGLRSGGQLVSAELEAADRLLDDDRFFQPFIRMSRTPMGRPSTPVEQYLRLMYLKLSHGLSFEAVVHAVAGNEAWRSFCRIPLDKPVPHYTTLVRWTQDYGEETVRRIHEELARKLESGSRAAAP